MPAGAFDLPSGCRGWLVRDLASHLVIDAQDVLITLATPAEDAPTADALSYWTPTPTPPDRTDPHDALTVRLAAAYEDPDLLKGHLEDLGGAAERAAPLAEPDLPVAIQGMSLTVRDFLHAYVLEWTSHHLDLVAHLDPEDAPAPPPVEGLAEARDMVERRLRARLPAGWADADARAWRLGARRSPMRGGPSSASSARAGRSPLSFG
ncbi:maleylpyruvate isomerase N-terminal domain-containing protein [Brachybacterium sp. GPGPB12]|uniref:maleylpyruvate isomerase N-terminal domain-containing protein n=1 Tax=Brachybacterium sp. GPGPB12 TaxID=3023517 RepID=UPI00313431AE